MDQFTEPKRARRRRDLLRMKARARRLFPQDERAHHLANNIAFCSRICCANPRRVFLELTMAEQRADEALKADLDF